ncbi:MAG: aspartyl protease family protein [Rhizomicrobium sp.]
MRFHACATSIALAAWTTILAGACPAIAETCKPLRIVNTIQLENVGNSDRFLVPVTINGSPKKLILDTGGVLTSLGRGTIKDLGLDTMHSNVQLNDVAGNYAFAKVLVNSFDLGALHADKIKLQVAPNILEQADGLLSTDLFLQYDVDMDFAARRLNYFSQDHCAGKVAYWQERPVAIMPVIVANGHLVIPVKLDGKNLNAIIDTGATQSILSLTAAKDTFGLIPDTPGLELIATSKDNQLLKWYKHKFSRLEFGDIAVTNPDVYVMTHQSGIEDEKLSIRGALNDPLNRYGSQQFTLGMDVLKHLHLYIAFGERKLYISPAGTGESVLFKSPAAPAN